MYTSNHCNYVQSVHMYTSNHCNYTISVANKGKRSQCPLSREWIKKLWSIYMTETDSPLKINKIGFFIELQMNLEPVIHQSN